MLTSSDVAAKPSTTGGTGGEMKVRMDRDGRGDLLSKETRAKRPRLEEESEEDSDDEMAADIEQLL